MKILFFLALLANLVFFLWQYNAGGFQQPTPETELTTPMDKQIWLVSELDQKPPVTIAATPHAAPLATPITAPATITTTRAKNTPATSAAPVTIAANPTTPLARPLTAPAVAVTKVKNNPSTAVVAVAPATTKTAIASATTTTTAATPAVKTFYCYQIKGFADKASATRWSQQQGINVASLQLKEIAPVVADYVVNYPAAATLAESKKNIEFLKTHGINNFFMINHGEFKGAISLAVFKNENRAIKAQQVFVSKGVNAKVSKRYKTPASVVAHIKTEKNKAQLLATLAKYARQPNVESLSQCE